MLKYKSLVILLYFDLNDESRNCISTTCAVHLQSFHPQFPARALLVMDEEC